MVVVVVVVVDDAVVVALALQDKLGILTSLARLNHPQSKKDIRLGQSRAR